MARTPTAARRERRRFHRDLSPASPLTESNRRPFPYHGNALPTELRGRSPLTSTPPPAPSRRALTRLHSGAGACQIACSLILLAPNDPGLVEPARGRVLWCCARYRIRTYVACAADLQSAPFGRSGNLASCLPQSFGPAESNAGNITSGRAPEHKCPVQAVLFCRFGPMLREWVHRRGYA